MTDQPLRIALLTHSFNPRGGVVHTLELAEALRALGHAPTVFAPARAGEKLFRAVRVPVERVPLPDAPAADLAADVGRRIAAFEQHLQAVDAPRRFDLFHAHDPIGANALIRLRERGQVPHVVRTVHHLDHYTHPQLADWQARGFLEADQVLCVSTLWQETLLAEHGVQAGLVFNGVDTRRFHPAPGLQDTLLRQRLGLETQAPIVLSLGGIEARKNTVRLLQAFASLREAVPTARLVVAGGASLLDHRESAHAFQQVLSALGLRSGPGEPVLVTGPLTDEDVPALMRIATVTAMPSLREGFGLVVLESLACGTPVLVSRIRPFIDHLAEGDAHWADPLDVPSIALALQQAVAQAMQPDTAARTAAIAQRLAAHYDWRASARRHLSHYARLLAQAQASRTDLPQAALPTV